MSSSHPSSLRGALVKYCVAAMLLTVVLRFVSGRGDWYRAWLYVALTTGAQVAAGVGLMRRHPDLLVERSRMQPGTKRFDRVLAPIVALAGPVAMWATAAWEVRGHWPPPVPVAASAVAFAVCLLGILLTGRSMMENRFFAATVRIQNDRGHVVVDSGPYSCLRHPGYTGALAFTLATPFALGSYVAIIPAALTCLALVIRTELEDRTLRAELPGYALYATRVRSRLIPGVW